MGNKRSISEEELKILNDGDKHKMLRSGETEKEVKTESKGDERKLSETEESSGEETQNEEVEEEEVVAKRHIHPCVCDLTEKQKLKIETYLRKKRISQQKYDKRVKEIELELARIEEERLEREREAMEQEELFGDEYEIVGKKKKRKKRAARRASMVSLGVKQIINWRKPPKIEVKYTHLYELRKQYTSYCGRSECPLSPPLPINFRKEPNIPIRATHTLDLRTSMNVAKKDYLVKHEDKRPRFVTDHFVA